MSESEHDSLMVDQPEELKGKELDAYIRSKKYDWLMDILGGCISLRLQCAGFVWDRVNYLHNGGYGAILGFIFVLNTG